MNEDRQLSKEISGVPISEFADRVEKVRSLAEERGLAGLIVFGRGGGTYERHADLLYLTGHYTTFSAIADKPPHWRMRGHAAALITPESVVLISDDYPSLAEVHADRVISTVDLPTDLLEAINESGVQGKLGVIGADAISGTQLRYLDEILPAFQVADDLLVDIRSIKSPAEQELLREAGRIGSQAIEAAIEAVEIGASVMEIAARASQIVISQGAGVVNIFAEALGPDRPARQHLHPAFADDVPLREGDVFTIDMSGALGGYFFDFSRSRVAGSDLHEGRAAFETAFEVVNAVTDALVAGNTVGDVAKIGFDLEARSGLDLGPSGFDAMGHGLGLGFENPWMSTDNETVLAPGMCLAVERFVNLGEVGATFEHNAIVTEGAPEILDSTPANFRG
ncbi:MAG: aminopeptidase P family protein [Thermoleophilia bacterium]|nr:aminopeptidase P family protein [Thermoleophilia bacterium]